METRYYAKRLPGCDNPVMAMVSTFKTIEGDYACTSWLEIDGEEVCPETYHEYNLFDANWHRDWWHKSFIDHGYDHVGTLFGMDNVK